MNFLLYFKSAIDKDPQELSIFVIRSHLVPVFQLYSLKRRNVVQDFYIRLEPQKWHTLDRPKNRRVRIAQLHYQCLEKMMAGEVVDLSVFCSHSCHTSRNLFIRQQRPYPIALSFVDRPHFVEVFLEILISRFSQKLCRDVLHRLVYCWNHQFSK